MVSCSIFFLAIPILLIISTITLSSSIDHCCMVMNIPLLCSFLSRANRVSETAHVASSFSTSITQFRRTIPILENFPIATTIQDKLVIAQRQRKAADSLLVFASQLKDENGVGVATMIKLLHKSLINVTSNTEEAEERFKEAIRNIEDVSYQILTKLPKLVLYLKGGRLCDGAHLIWDLIKTIDQLLSDLENARVPVEALKYDVQRISTTIEEVKTTIEVHQIINTAESVQFERNEALYNNAWAPIFIKTPDIEKEKMRLIDGEHMKRVMNLTDMISESIDPALIQIKIAVEHLKMMKSDLWNAYKALQFTLIYLQEGKTTKLIENYNCSKDALFYMTDSELKDIDQEITKTINGIETIREKNSAVIKQISLLGFSAIRPK